MVFSCFHKHFNIKLEHENTSNIKHSQSNGPLVRLHNYMLHSERALIIGLGLITSPSSVVLGRRTTSLFLVGPHVPVCLPTGIYISSCSQRLKTVLFQANFLRKYIWPPSYIYILKTMWEDTGLTRLCLGCIFRLTVAIWH